MRRNQNLPYLILFLLYLSYCDAFCVDQCNGRGFCIGDTCNCFLGFDDSLEEGSDCKASIVDLPVFILMRVWFCIVYFFGFTLSVFGFLFSPQNRTSGAIVNIRKMVMVAVGIGCLLNFLSWSIDPMGLRAIFPRFLALLFLEVSSPIILAIFIIILFHWMELYEVASNALKQQEMIQKINNRYKGEVTVEDILSKVKSLRRLRLPFVVLVAFSFVVLFTCQAVVTYTKFGMKTPIVYYSYFLVCALIVGIGFLIFGRRLSNLMPVELSRKIRRLTGRVIVSTCFMLIYFITGFAIIVANLTPYNSRAMGYSFYFNTIVCIVYYSFLAAYMKLTRKFPFLFNASTKTFLSKASVDSSRQTV